MEGSNVNEKVNIAMVKCVAAELLGDDARWGFQSAASSARFAPMFKISEKLSLCNCFDKCMRIQTGGSKESDFVQDNFLPYAMGSVLIQGGSRGLGLQFSKILACRSEVSKVVVTSRKAQNEIALLQLKNDFPEKIALVNLDVSHETDIKEKIATISDNLRGKLDLLVNCSAILHPSGRGETSLRDVSASGLLTTFQTNTVGPLLMAKYFSPLLLKGNGMVGSQKEKNHAGILVNITAKVSSISENNLGGWYSYRMSKTALNMATKNLSIELGRGKSKVICVALHPGTVNTDLSRPYHRGVPPEKLFSVETSVNHLMNIIDSLTVEASGKVFSWDGSQIPY